jgi:glycosyltransferase involved in cell wall biosynthesis
MRVAIVFPYINDNESIVKYALQMAKRFEAFASVKLIGIGSRQHQPENKAFSFHFAGNSAADYELALHTINSQFDICLLHHDFYGFGLQDGLMTMPFVAGIRIPLVALFHQLNHQASDRQRNIISSIGQYATQALVMSAQSVDVLEHIYKVPREKIRVIEYAIEDYQPLQRDDLRKDLGYWGQQVIVSAGLLQRSDNVNVVIEMISSLRVKYPNILFKHIGVTHPREFASNGEGYRTELNLQIRRLGLQQHVVLENRAMTDVELMSHLEASDIFMDANENADCQLRPAMLMALTAGCVVVSSSFGHSLELLKDKRGEICSFEQLDVLTDKLAVLLNDNRKLSMYRQSARDLGQHFEWQRVAPRYKKILEEVIGLQPRIESQAVNYQLLTPFDNSHLSRLMNPMGVIVSSFQGIPEVASYNLTYNAIALMVCNERYLQLNDNESLDNLNKAVMALNHFWGQKIVSKQVSYDINSDDAAITIAALGCFARQTQNGNHREWARTIVLKNIQTLNASTSTLSLSFIIMGLVDLLTVFPAEELVIKHLKELHQQLALLFEQTVSAEWGWFEDIFTVDTSVHALALLKSSIYLVDNESIGVVEKSIGFLVQKSFEEGYFTSLTSRSKLKTKIRRTDLEQSSSEVMWMALLCLEMGRFTHESDWFEKALQCYLWFLGENSIRRSLYHFESGAVANSIKGNQINQLDGALGTLSFAMAQVVGYESFCMKYLREEMP